VKLTGSSLTLEDVATCRVGPVSVRLDPTAPERAGTSFEQAVRLSATATEPIRG
jgi:hypothetical protein